LYELSEITDPELKWFDDGVNVIFRYLGHGNDKGYRCIEPRMDEIQSLQTNWRWLDDSDNDVAFLGVKKKNRE
jgi:hypothetical protein